MHLLKVVTAQSLKKLKGHASSFLQRLSYSKDMAHFNIDLAPIVARANEVDILHVRPHVFLARIDPCVYSKCILRRHPIKDFDPLSLRKLLGSLMISCGAVSEGVALLGAAVLPVSRRGQLAGSCPAQCGG